MLSQFTNVWNEITTFLVSLFPSLEGLFYNATEQSLTFVGTLSVIMAGVALVLLVKFVDPIASDSNMQTT